MSALVETMAYAKSGGIPWHRSGTPVSDDLSPQEMQEKAGLLWTVEKVPLGVMKRCGENGEPEYTGRCVPGKFGLQRSSDGRILSVVGSQYNIVQVEEAFAFFSKFVKAAHMTMETAGSLKDGQFIWVLAKMADTFKVGGGKSEDEILNYLLLVSPFAANRALLSNMTGVRAVCWNTVTAALGGAFYKERGHRSPLKVAEGAKAFRMPHIQKFDEAMQKKAEIALGLATQQVAEFKVITNLLAKTMITEEKAHEFFFRVLRLDDEKLAAIESGEDEKPQLLEKLESALINSPGANLKSAQGTLWGAFNAVTYVIDHELGRTDDNRLYRAWLGGGAEMKRRALQMAVEDAKAAA